MAEAIHLDYIPISEEEVEECVATYERLMKEVQEEWEIESRKYEETLANPTGDGDPIPRRNYANPTGTIQDPSLFPYHDSCYALLDCYDGLYVEDEEMMEQPIPSNSIKPSLSAHPAHGWVEPPRIENVDDGFDQEDDDNESAPFLLCTAQSIMGVLFHRQKDPRSFDVIDKLPEHVTNSLCQRLLQDSKFQRLRENSGLLSDTWNVVLSLSECSPTASGLPSDPKQRLNLLLRLLKHAMSELQRDHMLASAIVARLAMDDSLGDAAVLRRVLTIMASEYIGYSDFDWNDPDHHSCKLWKFLFAVLNIALEKDEFLTQDVAITIAGFSRFVYWREFGHLLETKDATKRRTSTATSAGFSTQSETNHVSSHEQILSLHLKRALVASRMEEQDDLDDTAAGGRAQTPTRLLLCMIDALGRRGECELDRLANATLNEENERWLAKCLDSYYNCIRVLVSIAQNSLGMLPTSERFFQIASTLVPSITASLVYVAKSGPLDPRSIMSGTLSNSGLCFIGEPFLPQMESFVRSPFRLADRIRNATKYARDQRTLMPVDPIYNPIHDQPISFESCCLELSHMVNLSFALRKALHGQPHDDIQKAVRDLFVRDGIYLTIAGMGYGDVVVWCRFRVEPLDPVLHNYEFNHILPDDVESDDDSEDEAEDSWEEMWNKPIHWAQNETENIKAGELWCHFNFQLMAMRVALEDPWSPESHMSFSCGFRKAAQETALCLGRYQFPREVVEAIISYLPRQAWPEDRQFNDMHTRSLGIEPFYSGTVKEHAAFCRAIADGSYKSSQDVQTQLVDVTTEGDWDDVEDDDDEGSWESIDTEEERAMADTNPTETTMTQAITQYMREHRIKAPDF